MVTKQIMLSIVMIGCLALTKIQCCSDQIVQTALLYEDYSHYTTLQLFICCMFPCQRTFVTHVKKYQVSLVSSMSTSTSKPYSSCTRVQVSSTTSTCTSTTSTHNSGVMRRVFHTITFCPSYLKTTSAHTKLDEQACSKFIS